MAALAYTMVVRNGRETDSSGRSAGKGALIQTERASTLNTVQDQYLFQPTAYSFDPLSSNSMKSKNPHSGCREVEVARTIDTTDPNPSKNQGGLAIVEPVCCIDGDKIGKAERAGGSGLGIRDGDKMYTLTAKDAGTHSVCIPIQDQATRFAGKRGDKQDGKGNGLGIGADGDPVFTLTGGDRHAVCDNYIVRRLTPTECARLQGFADWWGHIEKKTELTDEEHRFWMDVRNTHAAINGKAVKDYTKPQMLTWYNKLWTDGAEYKMWGNGIALPPALYCMQGITDVLNREEDDSWLL